MSYLHNFPTFRDHFFPIRLHFATRVKETHEEQSCKKYDEICTQVESQNQELGERIRESAKAQKKHMIA